MKPITSKYRIHRISRVYNDVEMALSEISKVQFLPPPEAEKAQIDLKRVIGPMPMTDDERVVDDYMKAIKKMAPSLYAVMQQMNKPPSLPQVLTASVDPAPKRLANLEVVLSLGDYQKLGSPSLDSIIEVTLKVSRDKQRKN